MHAAILKIFIVCLMLTSLALAVPQIPSDQGLARLFFSSRFTRQDPELTFACFIGYKESSIRISDTYSKAYKECIQHSVTSRATVDKEVSTERQSIFVLAQSVCGRINHCNALNNSMEYFGCHAESGSSNTKATYIISTNSSDFVTILQERYRTIQLNEEKCYGLAERIYVKETTHNYDHLQACLSGQAQPTTTTSTTSRPTTTTTTEGPQEPELPTVAAEELEQLLGLV